MGASTERIMGVWKPGERKWGTHRKDPGGFDVQFSVTGRSTRFVSLVLFIHVMILAQLPV
ncbi:hypothetical protein Scep_004400 [Stephania cephalantha]|uniref:Uncharacterized protein n=1 Tax=Stephania cephalantha TaxID=152367 RepID=A0AAP0PZ24_9MAGN